MKAVKFDQKFDASEKVTELLDLKKARRPGVEARRVNVDFPAWMVESIDRPALAGSALPSVAHQDVAHGTF